MSRRARSFKLALCCLKVAAHVTFRVRHLAANRTLQLLRQPRAAAAGGGPCTAAEHTLRTLKRLCVPPCDW